MNEKIPAPLQPKIEKETIDNSVPELGGTKIVLQRHAKYDRSVGSDSVGSLTREGAEDTYQQSIAAFEEMLSGLSDEEKTSLAFLVLASDTQYAGGGRRSVETAEMVIKGLKDTFAKYGLAEQQLLNVSGNFSNNDKPRLTPDLGEPKMFENSPEFVSFLKEKYGDLTIDFWRAFEEDKEKETREKLGAEGPDEIVERIKLVINVLSRYSRLYHKNNPNHRLIIWAVTHYDTISPFVKRELYGVEKDFKLEVDNGAGISINIDPEGNSAVPIGESTYKI